MSILNPPSNPSTGAIYTGTNGVVYQFDGIKWIIQSTNGPVGPSGPAGFQGVQGVQGVTGQNGIQGIQGLQGSSIQGTQGVPGPSGAQGVSGPQGPNANQALDTTSDVEFNSVNIGSGGLTTNGNAHITGNLQVDGVFTFTGTATILSVSSATFFGDTNGFKALYAGVVGYTPLPVTVIQATADYNDYVQINFQNINPSAQASTDWVATADNGNDTTNFVDLGIAGSNWDGSQSNSLGSAVQANDSYLWAQGGVVGGNLVLASTTPKKSVKIVAGGIGAGYIVAQFTSTGLILSTGTSITFGDGSSVSTANGLRGPSGPSGANGSNGATGPSGPSGANGSNGATGPSGPSGANGSNGATGPSGPSGANGSNGATGPSGPSGANGSNGSNGATGPSGPSGPSGSGGVAALTGLTSTISWSTIGVGSPTFTTSSVGTKLLLYPSETSSMVDYAIGIEPGVQWSSIPNATGNFSFKWYAGTSTIASLSNTGTFIASTLNVSNQITTPAGSNANLVLNPDGLADVIVTTATQIIMYATNTSISTTTGALVVSGGVGVGGTVTANKFVGDGSSLTNVTVTQQANIVGVQPNVSLIAGNYTYLFDNTGVLTLPSQSITTGNEGGEIDFTKSPSSSLSGTVVVVDQYVDRLRFFENSGTNRGVYIDLTQAAAGVGTLLNNRVSGFVNSGTFVTMDNLKATVTTSGNRGLSLATTTGTLAYSIGGTYGMATPATGGSAGTGTLTTTPTASIFNWGFTSIGDLSTYVLTDTTNNKCYRITVQIGASFNNNSIIIERLI